MLICVSSHAEEISEYYGERRQRQGPKAVRSPIDATKKNFGARCSMKSLSTSSGKCDKIGSLDDETSSVPREICGKAQLTSSECVRLHGISAGG
jgi:hypothetical protein